MYTLFGTNSIRFNGVGGENELIYLYIICTGSERARSVMIKYIMYLDNDLISEN